MTENHPDGIQHKNMHWPLRPARGLASGEAGRRRSANAIQPAVYFSAEVRELRLRRDAGSVISSSNVNNGADALGWAGVPGWIATFRPDPGTRGTR